MQPHRIQRAIMDDVADAEDFARGEWFTNLQDTDQIVVILGDYCDKAGPAKCALYTEGGGQAISNKYEDTMDSLYENPIGVPVTGLVAPDLITYSDIMGVMAKPSTAPFNSSLVLQAYSMISQIGTASHWL